MMEAQIEARVDRVNSNDNGSGKWRLTKDVPISLVVFLAFQTILFTWFLAGQSAKLAAVADDNAASKATTYTKEDAMHEREFMNQRFLLIDTKTEETTRRIALLEAAVLDLKSRMSK
jgi:hypothetical protein